MGGLEEFLVEKYNISESAKSNYRNAFKRLGQLTDRPFDLGRQELADCLHRLSQMCSARTFNLYVVLIKAFYRWKTKDKNFMDWADVLPVSNLQYVQTKILSESEINALLRVCVHPRDRALIAVAVCTGLRRSSLIGLTIRDLIPQPYGYDLASVQGKTFTLQPPPIVREFAKILRVWLEHHPYRDNPDAPLWIRLKGDKIEGITGVYAEQRLKEMAERAGLKRRVHLHMFRHTSATWYAKHKVTEAELRLLFGWSRNSRTPSVYVSLTAEDAKNAGLRAHGLVSKKKEEVQFGTVKCLYCGEENATVSKYCHFCGTLLDRVEAEESVTRQKILMEAAKLLTDPEVMEKLKKLKLL